MFRSSSFLKRRRSCSVIELPDLELPPSVPVSSPHLPRQRSYRTLMRLFRVGTLKAKAPKVKLPKSFSHSARAVSNSKPSSPRRHTIVLDDTSQIQDTQKTVKTAIKGVFTKNDLHLQRNHSNRKMNCSCTECRLQSLHRLTCRKSKRGLPCLVCDTVLYHKPDPSTLSSDGCGLCKLFNQEECLAFFYLKQRYNCLDDIASSLLQQMSSVPDISERVQYICIYLENRKWVPLEMPLLPKVKHFMQQILDTFSHSSSTPATPAAAYTGLDCTSSQEGSSSPIPASWAQG